MFKFICQGRNVPHFRVCHVASSSPIYSLLSRSLSSSSTTLNSISNSSNQKSFTVNYLINSCGLTPESALSASKSLKLKTLENPDSVLALLKNYGFTNTQMVAILKKLPTILLRNPQKTLLPKLECFSSIGFSRPELVRIFTAAPTVFSYSIEGRIIPSYNFFRDLLQSDEKTLRMFKQFPYMLVYGNPLHVAQNVQALRDAGVPERYIIRHVSQKPTFLTRGTDDFRKIMHRVKEMGFDPLKHTFMWAFHAFTSMSKLTFEKKVGIYKKWGWSDDDVLVAFQKCPACLFSSEDKITKVMDFFINNMHLKCSLLVNRPILFSFSLEKKIIPRCLFYQAMLDKGLIKKEKDSSFVNGWVSASENDFIRRIRNNYKEEAPQLLKIYQAMLDSAK